MKKWINANDRLPGWETPVRWRFDGYETANKETITEVAYRRPITISAHEWLDEEDFEPCEATLKLWFEKGSIVCCEGGCKEIATKDYNGHGHFVCSDHYDKLNDYFDENYS